MSDRSLLTTALTYGFGRAQPSGRVRSVDGTWGLAGIKIGNRFDRVGAFVKVRAGLMRYGRTFSAIDTTANPPLLSYSPQTAAVADIGGVLSFYLGRRWLVRLDAGDLMVPARDVVFTTDGESFQVPFDLEHTMSLAVGVGWRY